MDPVQRHQLLDEIAHYRRALMDIAAVSGPARVRALRALDYRAAPVLTRDAPDREQHGESRVLVLG
jgi:hypothetical protein